MKSKLTARELSNFCGQMGILLHSGISTTEGLHILCEESKTDTDREILKPLINSMEKNGSLSQALEDSGCFPKAMTAYIKTGEETGCLDEIMTSLSRHYDQEQEISQQIRSAVTYPLIMLGMMAVVILVLLVKVLPVFQQVFHQMGLEMNGISQGLLNAGNMISRYSAVFLILAVLLIGCILFFSLTEKGHAKLRKLVTHLPVFCEIPAKTDSVFLLALCSIFMGFLRMVLMMVNLFTLIKYAGHIEAYDKITPGNEPVTGEGWDKLDIERSAAQPAIYLFFMVLGQLGTSLTAWLAFEYEWQYIHYFMMGLLLLCILITFITMPYHKYTTRRFPINLKQFGNASIFCITLACITYVLTYGKVLDWYDDPTIRWATVCAIIAGGIFLYIESTQRIPYYQLDVFKLRTIRMGFLFYFLLMVLNSSAMFALSLILHTLYSLGKRGGRFGV